MSFFNIVAATNEDTVVATYEPSKVRSDSYQSEAELEKEFIRLLCEQGYTYLPLHTEDELIANLRSQLEELNHYQFSDTEWQQFFSDVIANPNEHIPEKTRKIQEDNVQVLHRDDGSSKNITLIDKKNIHNNRLQVINQYEVKQADGARHDNRYDVTILVNGFPLVHVELKRRGVAIREAFNQINRYQRDSFWAGCGLYEYVQIFVISNGTNTKYYSNSTRYNAIKDAKHGKIKKEKTSNSFEFTSYWADANNRVLTDLIDFTRTFFAKHTILSVLTRYCIFTSEKMLMVMRPYQITATERILNRIEIANNYKKYGSIEGGGYIWHTTGSGKTLTSFKTARLASQLPYIDKVLFVVDRKDLDYQTMKEYDRFEKGAANSNTSTTILKRQLENPEAHIIITTIQKLATFIKKNPGHEVYQKHVVIIFDECHRSQFGDMHKAIVHNFKKYHLFGFTGTPISAKDRNTREVFGDYIDVYDMTQAVEDGATRPVYYESRVIKLHLDQNTLALIDATYDALEQQSDVATIEKSKKMLGQMESVLGADSTIQSLCEDIVNHYEKYRANLLTGKAMLVAYSRPIAMKIYRKLLELRPTWNEKIGVVMTGGNNDPEDWKEIIGTKSHKEELARKFKDNDDPMKIAIVVDMWLTGFDVPSLATMYVYKPMHGYNLMQAIARVNRVFKDKEGGLIVDYVGIASALKAAMKEYTKRDQSRYGDMDIAKVAYPKFQEKLQVCKDLLHGFDFSSFIDGSPLVMAKLVTGGVNFVLDAKAPKRKDLFLREAMLLKQSHSLCSSMTTEQERHEAAYMEAVRSTVVKITYGGSGGKTLSLKEINTQINELLKASIQSQGVISLFDSKQADENISLFDPAVLDEISKMKEKNIAVEILKKLMAEQVSLYKRTNVVQSQKFSEKIAQLMNSYYNGLITNEEVIKELLKTAQEITELYNNGKKLGLTQEELAFYDALTKPENIKDFYQNNELIDLTRELTEMLRKNRTIDWQKKETARASMRKMVKHLLKKYKYPPEDYDTAISTVISQCEMWTDNMTA